MHFVNILGSKSKQNIGISKNPLISVMNEKIEKLISVPPFIRHLNGPYLR